jgi:hypothetical protein
MNIGGLPFCVFEAEYEIDTVVSNFGVPMDEKRIIKVSENRVLVKKVLGFFTECDKCGKVIGGGEEIYSPHVKSENGLTIMRPICLECGEKSAPK